MRVHPWPMPPPFPFPAALPPDRPALAAALVAAAMAAGDVVWDHFRAGCTVATKADASPVTAADHAGEAVILAALARAAPGVAIVAEEEAAAGRIPETGDAFFLVDALDGTREFVTRRDDFTVNIGIVEHGAPTFGVVYAPAHGALYWGDVAGARAWHAARRPHGATGEARAIGVRRPAAPPRALGSRSHVSPLTDSWLAAAGIGTPIGVGSSLKFALIAAGEADVYPRTGPTMEWDTCAGDALLRAAGGMTFGPDGAPFRYGKPGWRNAGFVAAGGWTPPPLDPPRSRNGLSPRSRNGISTWHR